MRLWWFVVVVSFAVSGCGCAKGTAPVYAPSDSTHVGEPPESPDSLESQEPSPGRDFESEKLSGPGGDRIESMDRPPSYAQPPPDGAGFASNEIMQLLEDLAVAEDLALSTRAGCDHACKALRSMIRAADRLCALAKQPGEFRSCEEARLRVRRARDTVRSTCGHCSGGPELGKE